MRKLLGVAAAAILLGLASRAWALDGGRYGTVRLAEPQGPMRGYVVLFSDRGGWTGKDQLTLDALAKEGALAVGVDTDAYLAKLAASGDKCDQLVGDAEMLSRQLQHEHGDTEYQFPILAGIGAGGTLAWVTLTQAPVNTLSGAVSLDPSVDLPGAHPLCPGAPAQASGAGSFRYGPVTTLKGFWTVGLDDNATSEVRDSIDRLSGAGMPLEAQSVASTDPVETLPALVEPHLFHESPGGVASLPLIELPVEHPGHMMAVLLSGDGGWRDLDKSIAEDLQEDGIPVVGWDSVRYFWHKKTPERTAADLADVLSTYMTKWHADNVALIGFSFGADVLPFAYDRLPPALRRHVKLMSLLAFSASADWEITVSGWLGEPPGPDAVPVAPAMEAVPPRIIQCVYGEEEADSFCPSLAKSGAEVIRTSGGHHFDQDYKSIEARILAAFRARAEAEGERS